MVTSLRSYAIKSASLTAVTGLVSLGAVAGVAGAASPAPHATVPPIHEPFSHATCPAKPSTTVALEACAGDKVLSLDLRIDRLDTAIINELPAAGQTQFAAAAKQWLSYRNTVAKSAGSLESGGSAEPLAELDALATEDQAHITALTQEFTTPSGQTP